MILEILGMLTAAAVPATAVSATCASICSAVNEVDKVVVSMFPEELFDETEYYLQHLSFQDRDRVALGLHKYDYSLAWSAEELGSYALREGWVLTGSRNTPQVRREIRELLSIGEQRFTAMSQASG